MSLLPPNSTATERAIEQAGSELADVPVPLRSLWDPLTCPAELLPWLGWGLSVDFWSADWTEAEKREVIAATIEAQRRKGTPASLREVLDRFDPLITLTEWWQEKDRMDPHTFRLELPQTSPAVGVYDQDTIDALLRDIAAVKPLRAHMFVVTRLQAQARAGLLAGGIVAGVVRLDMFADTDSALDPAWDAYLQTADGEPLQAEDGKFLET